jgi:hypothetical protein
MIEIKEIYAPNDAKHVFLVSNFGTVVNLTTTNPVGTLNERGYKHFSYVRIDGSRKQMYIGKLVMKIFGKPPGKYKSITYLDGDRANCRLDNLAYCDRKHFGDVNRKRWKKNPDMCKTNPGRGGHENRFNSRLSDDEIRAIRKMEGTDFELSIELKLREHVIKGIRNGKTFKWIV